MKTRITVVASYFYPKIGGLENYAYNLALRLVATGEYEVNVITANHDGRGYRKESLDGMTVHRLPIAFKISNTPLNPRWRNMVKRIFAAERPDVVHTHSPVPGLADIAAKIAAAKGIPVVATYHAGSMRKGSWPMDAMIGTYESVFLPKLFGRAAAIVAVSQGFVKRAFPQFAAKTYFIPTGVDLSRFKRTPLPETDAGAGMVTFVGRIERTSRWKGIDELLQAMAIVIMERPHATLDLVGGGDDVEHYRARAKELGIESSVIFSGPQTGQGVVDAYRRSSVVVLPSTSDAEAFGTVFLEAMASCRPIIGTNIGGISQAISHEENGLIVPPKDPRALASAILEVLDDQALAMRLADKGAEKVRDFSWDIQTKKYRDLFDKVLSKTTL